jgi:cell wall-associated NlpC family hydrolase
MTPYFETPERIAALDAEARTWIGTPFFAHSCAKGRDGGVDCVHLVQDILTTCGAMERQVLPSFPMDWADHRSESVVLGVFTNDSYFAEHFVALPFPATQAEPGDILCFRMGACVHHIGLMLLGGHFIHALKPEGATILPLDVALAGQKVLGKIVRLYRPVS